MAAMEQSLIEQYKDVYVFAQQVDNEISPIAFELLGKAKDLANDLNEKVVAVLLGHNVKDLAAQLGAYGADKVIVVDDKELEVYRTEPYTHALASVINEFKPEIMLVGATAIGRDLGPRVSARVQTGLTADCTHLDVKVSKYIEFAKANTTLDTSTLDPNDPSNIPGTCIKCCACTTSCPSGAKKFDDPDFLSHTAMLEKFWTESRKENAVFL